MFVFFFLARIGFIFAPFFLSSTIPLYWHQFLRCSSVSAIYSCHCPLPEPLPAVLSPLLLPTTSLATCRNPSQRPFIAPIVYQLSDIVPRFFLFPSFTFIICLSWLNYFSPNRFFIVFLQDCWCPIDQAKVVYSSERNISSRTSVVTSASWIFVSAIYLKVSLFLILPCLVLLDVKVLVSNLSLLSLLKRDLQCGLLFHFL